MDYVVEGEDGHNSPHAQEKHPSDEEVLEKVVMVSLRSKSQPMRKVRLCRPIWHQKISNMIKTAVVGFWVCLFMSHGSKLVNKRCYSA